MANTLTDQHDLIKIENAHGYFKLFSRSLSVSDGYCIIVLRRENYFASILSQDITFENDLKKRCEKIGVKDDDVLMRVNLGSRILHINDSLSTLDGFRRPYQLELEISISNARQFALLYRQQSDPLDLARRAIEGYIQRYTAGRKHDELRQDMLQDLAERALLDASNKQLGVKVVKAHKALLGTDPNREKELKIMRDEHIKRLEHREQATTKKVEVTGKAEIEMMTTRFDLERKGVLADNTRIEDEKQKRHELSIEAFVTEEGAKLRRSVRVDELDEKDHQIELDTRQKDFLRLQDGRDNQARRDEEERQQDFLRIEATRSSRAVREEQREQNTFQRSEESDDNEYKRLQELKERKYLEERDIAMRKHNEIVQSYVYVQEEKDVEHRLAITEKENTAKRRGDLLEQTSTEVTEVFIERLRDSLERDDGSLDRALEENPLLKEMFQLVSPASRMKQNPEASTTKASVNESTTEDTSRQQADKPEEKDPKHDMEPLMGILQQQQSTIDIPEFGLTLIQTTLSEDQRENADIKALTAYLLCRVAPEGPAQKAQMAVGDILFRINGQIVHNSQSLSSLLASYKLGTPTQFSILRGESLVTRNLS